MEISLEKQVARLQDIEEIRTLKAKYACALDNNYDAEAVAALFCEEGRWHFKGLDGAFYGREEIKQHCRNGSKTHSKTFHNITPAIIDVSSGGDRATGIFFLISFVTMREGSGEGETVSYHGRYQDTFVKMNGRWYFEEVCALVEQSIPCPGA